MAFLRVLCWALIFILRMRFLPGKSLKSIWINYIFEIERFGISAKWKHKYDLYFSRTFQKSLVMPVHKESSLFFAVHQNEETDKVILFNI